MGKISGTIGSIERRRGTTGNEERSLENKFNVKRFSEVEDQNSSLKTTRTH
jgi:hypothetical protein